MKKERIVVALGGNALGKTPKEQKRIVRKTARAIVDLALDGKKVVVCHGNGPQVGMINLSFIIANEKSNGKIPFLPLPEAGSMSQGYIGFHLQNAIVNHLKALKQKMSVVTVITQVEVDKNDPGFKNPSKPIGKFYTKEEAEVLAFKHNWVVGDDAGRGWRRFVPSPKPKTILEIETIKSLLDTNHIVIAGGGGGIPVYFENNEYHGVPAVIDKDWTAQKLADDLDADEFVIFTAVDRVSINYGKSNETSLEFINTTELKKYIAEEQFAKGSMLPKIEASMAFIHKNPTKKCIIASLDKALLALQGKSGTTIVK